MLTISQAARYVGLTPRAIRHYHAIGLLPEPPRTASDYRSYGAQDLVDLKRIKTLADAGVPLSRVKELVAADPQALRAAVTEIDRGLRARIKKLQATRRSLAALADGADMFLPPEVVELHERMARLGVSEKTLKMEREGWILILVLFPQLKDRWLATQLAMLDDPEYADLYLITEMAADWDPDDPRIDDLAHRTVDFMCKQALEESTEDWGEDLIAVDLVNNYRRYHSPAWDRLMDRLTELFTEQVG